MTDTTTEAEVMYGFRRTDGEDIGDYSFITTTKEDPWDALDGYEDDEPVEYELVRMDLTVVEKRTLGHAEPVCDQWEGWEQEAGTRWNVVIPKGKDDETWPGRPVELQAFETAAEADAAIAQLPGVFYMRWHGLKAQPIEKSSLLVIPEDVFPYATSCSKCRHPKADHRA